MDTGQSSDNLLAHFDRPKALDLPDFEWDYDAISLEAAAVVNHVVAFPDLAPERLIEVPRDTRRGICWVLAWAGALATLAIAASVLAEFAYVLAAERTLSIAARAGAMEATLPRATYHSVTASVDRRLNHYPRVARQLQLSILRNGTLVQSPFRQHEGDWFAVTLSSPSGSAIPDWLRTLMFWRGESEIRARAEQQLPGRKFAYGAGRPAASR